MNLHLIDALVDISSSLDRFQWIKHGTSAKCRCPICGDSRKDKRKARFSIFENSGTMFVHCYNCSYSNTLVNFIKNEYPSEYKNYLKNSLKSNQYLQSTPTYTQPKQYVSVSRSMSDLLTPVSELNINHIAIDYLESRMIPISMYSKIFYTDDLKRFSDSVTNKYLHSKFPNESGLVFVLKDSTNKIFGYQFRSLSNNSSLKYITLMLDDVHPKVYGLENVDQSKPFYICEGIFDSIFIENSIAMLGGDSNLNGFVNLQNAIYVFDNEPRHRDTINRMTKVIDARNKIAFWDIDPMLKDINEMVLNGLDVEYLNHHIQSNVFYGLKAKLKLAQWKKI